MVEKKRKKKKRNTTRLMFPPHTVMESNLWLLAFHLSCTEVVRIVRESKINNSVALGKVE